jgi:hypothetical protein
MNALKLALASALVALVFGGSPPAFADRGERYTLEFVPTQNALDGVRGTMSIKVVDGQSIVHFRLRGGYPDTVYTIWIVFRLLNWPLPTKDMGPSVPAATFPPGFHPEGNGVSPLGRMDKAFTDGMGLDQGITFVTNDNGDGEKRVKVDYNLVGGTEDGPPVGNKDITVQCAPSFTDCVAKVNVATTWLRRFIGEYPLAERASLCANYDPKSDPENAGVYAPPVSGIDARRWQCVDPATLRDPHDPWSGVPRVHRFQFDHFRLAPHPDALTHGLFGGNKTDHFIDMVGRRCEIVPPVGPPCP